MEHLVFAFLYAALSLASPALKWEPLTSKLKPKCESQSPCRVTMSTGVFEIEFAPALREGLQVLKNLKIKNLKNGVAQDFKLEEMNNIEEDAFFKLYKVQLRPGPDSDLALHAYNSAREGEVFYYFLYDRVHEKWVISEGTFPKLIYSKKTNRYASELQNTPYALGKDLKLAPAPEKSK